MEHTVSCPTWETLSLNILGSEKSMEGRQRGRGKGGICIDATQGLLSREAWQVDGISWSWPSGPFARISAGAVTVTRVHAAWNV